jgi:tRNA acetyltransferase TAN1
MRTIAPVNPVLLVNKICEDAMANPNLKRTRFAKRLSPMTLMARASVEGLEQVAKAVLAPHFHQTPFQKRKVSASRVPV